MPPHTAHTTAVTTPKLPTHAGSTFVALIAQAVNPAAAHRQDGRGEGDSAEVREAFCDGELALTQLKRHGLVGDERERSDAVSDEGGSDHRQPQPARGPFGAFDQHRQYGDLHERRYRRGDGQRVAEEKGAAVRGVEGDDALGAGADRRPERREQQQEARENDEENA